MPATDGFNLEHLRESDHELVRVVRHADHTAVSLTGTVGIPVIRSLREEMIRLLDADGDIVVDCAKADHLDCSVLQVLLALQTSLAGQQRQLRIESESAGVRKYLDLAGLAARFPVKQP